MQLKSRVREIITKLKKASFERTKRKLPKGTITFPLTHYMERNLDWKKINEIKQKFNLQHVFLIHGVALKTNDRTIIISGPPAIGKSTILRKLARQNKIQAIDDGGLLIGKKTNGSFVLIQSGTYPERALKSKISRTLRGHGLYQGPFVNPKATEKQFSYKTKYGDLVSATSELIGSRLLKDKSKETFNPKAFNLNELILIPHEKDYWPGRVLNQNKLGELNYFQLRKIFSKQGIEVNTLNIFDKNLKQEIENAILKRKHEQRIIAKETVRQTT